MANYITIKGYTLQNRTSDPLTEGALGASWSSGGNLNEGREATGTAGISNSSAMIFGGQNPGSNPVNAEVYNGSAWTEVGNLTTIRWNSAGFGTVTAAIAAGGENPGGNLATTNSWNGSAWTEVGDLNQARAYCAGIGTATAGIAVAGYTTTRVDTVEAWNGNSWTEIAEVNTARSSHGRSGLTNTDGLIFGGQTSPGAPNYTNATESWNGTAWAELNNLNAAKSQINTSSGTGASDGLASGGILVPGTRVAQTEFFNGTSWTELNDLSVARTQIGSAGTASSTMAAGGNTGSGTPTSTEEWTAAGPADSIIDTGQIFYRSDTGDMKVTLNVLGTGAFSTGATLPTAKDYMRGIGVQTAALGVAGTTGPYGEAVKTNSYNGTAWSEVGNLNLGRSDGTFAADGTQGAGIISGGQMFPSPGGVLDQTETWDGSSWTEVSELNTARDNLTSTSAGTSTASLAFMGGTPAPNTGKTESWNGASWTEVGDLNTPRERGSGGGSSTAAIAIDGAQAPAPANPDGVKYTEIWNGNSWTEVADTNTAHYYGAGWGTTTSALIAGTNPASNIVEQWNGSAWSEVAEMGTNRVLHGGGVGGPGNTSGIIFGGNDGSISNAVEEWNIPQTVTNKTITD